MTMDALTHGILVLGGLGTAFAVAREFDIYSNGERPPRLVTLEAGSLMGALLWAVVAFNSFEVATGANDPVAHTGLALLSAGIGIVLALIFVGSVLGTITPARSEMDQLNQ